MASADLTDSSPRLGEFGYSGDDHVVPFQVSSLDLRGRIVQLGPVLDQLLERHNYPEPVAGLLAEAIVLTVLLGTSLKFEGKFIVQTQSNGPVDMLVVDFAPPHSLRAYAHFDTDAIKEAIAAGSTSTQDLLGEGVLALTIDQGANTQRYQGVVQLDGMSMETIASTYFRQSEQIPTEIRLTVAKQVQPGEGGATEHWRAGGVIVQFLPESGHQLRMPDLPGGDDSHVDEIGDDPMHDTWREAVVLLATIEPSELIDPQVGTERLLYRLFHQHGVRVFDGIIVRDVCSCSREKIRSILDGFSSQEIEDSIEDGHISVNCEFCSKSYRFQPDEFASDG